MASEVCNVLTCGVINIQSVSNKTIEIRELINERSLDILALTETWLDSNSSNSRIAELTPETHTFHHVPRKTGIGGGVGVLVSNCFSNIKMEKSQNYNTFEHLEINFTYVNRLYKVVVIYRPPPKINFDIFLDEFEELMSMLSHQNRKILVTGDLNIWFDDTNNNYTRRTNEIIDRYNLRNIIEQKTSRSDHVLDVVLCENDDVDLSDIQVDSDFSLSYYHKLITFKIKVNKTKNIKKKIIFRRKRFFEDNSFIEDSMLLFEMKKNLLCSCHCQRMSEESVLKFDCVEYLTLLYYAVFRDEYDRRCPIVEKEIIEKENAPWWNGEILSARRKRRSAEKKVEKKKDTAPMESVYCRKKQCE